jgi:hypothetical protein
MEGKHEEENEGEREREIYESSLAKFFFPLHPSGGSQRGRGARRQRGSRIRTLSDDRHPAGRHTVIDGMMEVFGDRSAKISQIGRRAWNGGPPPSSNVVAASRPSSSRFSRARYPVRRIGEYEWTREGSSFYAPRANIADRRRYP